ANSNANADNPSDAVFRLAASLDQLGARLEERINSNHRELGQSVQGLSQEFSKEVEALKAIASAPRPEPEKVPEKLIVHEPAESASTESSGTQDEKAKDDDWDHEDSSRHSRLGLLDMLDDLGRILPRRTSPALERPHVQPGAQTDAFVDIQDEGWK